MAKVCFFSFRKHEKSYYSEIFKSGNYSVELYDFALTAETALLVHGATVVSAFVNDQLNAHTLDILYKQGVRMITLRCAGTNQVDGDAAKKLGISIYRVPKYSPNAVAEHTLALAMSLIRKIPRAFNRVREMNFDLSGLEGFTIAGKTVGIVGWGDIGSLIGKYFHAMGARVLAFDVRPRLSSQDVEFCDMKKLLSESNIISLNCPLTKESRHLVNEETLKQMKPGVVILNSGRGALIDTKALIRHLKSGHVGGVALDVYEQEDELFFDDHSSELVKDEMILRLLSFPNVLITGHQGFLTKEALATIAHETNENILGYLQNKVSPNRWV